MENPTGTLKSDRTRARILAAAEHLFAERGYERTTIREISALAEIDPAMVMRYFGNKECLFARAAVFDLRLPDLRALKKSRTGAVLVEHFLRIWEGETAGNGLVILLRAAASNEGAAETLRGILRAQIQPAIRRVSPSKLSPTRAGLVASQMLGFALGRYVLKLPPLVSLSKQELVLFLGPVIQHYIFGELKEEVARS